VDASRASPGARPSLLGLIGRATLSWRRERSKREVTPLFRRSHQPDVSLAIRSTLSTQARASMSASSGWRDGVRIDTHPGDIARTFDEALDRRRSGGDVSMSGSQQAKV
jgi:hypothetical protein